MVYNTISILGDERIMKIQKTIYFGISAASDGKEGGSDGKEASSDNEGMFTHIMALSPAQFSF